MEKGVVQPAVTSCAACSICAACIVTPVPDFELSGTTGIFGLF